MCEHFVSLGLCSFTAAWHSNMLLLICTSIKDGIRLCRHKACELRLHVRLGFWHPLAVGHSFPFTLKIFQIKCFACALPSCFKNKQQKHIALYTLKLMPQSRQLAQLEPVDPPCSPLRLKWQWLVRILDLCSLRWWILVDQTSAEKWNSLLEWLVNNCWQRVESWNFCARSDGYKPVIFPSSGWSSILCPHPKPACCYRL